MRRLLENITGKEIAPVTLLDVIEKDNLLSFHFICHDSFLSSYSNKDNDTLYKDNVCEVFLDIGEENSYLEIEVAPNGAKFVANIVYHGEEREIVFIDDDFLKTNAKINGQNYEVEMVFDLTKLNNPPHIKYNAFRIETQGIEPEHILLALSPTMCGSFHQRNAFIKWK